MELLALVFVRSSLGNETGVQRVFGLNAGFAFEKREAYAAYPSKILEANMAENALQKSAMRSLRVFLRIKHSTVAPDDITQAIGLDPVEAIKAGPSVSRGVQRLHSESYWVAELPTPTRDEITAEALRVASQQLSIRLDKAKLRESTAKLTEFTSPRASALMKNAAERLGVDPSSLREKIARDVHTASLQGFGLLAWLKSLDGKQEFFRQVRSTGGSVTLLVQRPQRNAPINITPILARRLADLEIELEID